MKQKLITLNSVRTVACIVVLLGHMHILHIASWSVSVFFSLSGFLLTYNYKDRQSFESISLGSSVKFGLSKIKKLYPLYLATLIISFLVKLAFIWDSKNLIWIFLSHTAVSVLLLQSIFPDMSYVDFLNGPAWYLSATMFLYFLFPIILRFVRQCRSIRQAFFSIIGCILVQGLLSFTVNFFSNNSDINYWFTYMCPLSRIFDIIAGSYAAYIFLSLGRLNISDNSATFLELFSIVFCLITQIVYCLGLFPAYISQAVLYLPSSVFLIYVFALGQGKISRFLTCKVITHISDLSSYIFLIHGVVIFVGSILINMLDISIAIRRVIYLISIPAVTYFLALMYARIVKSSKKQKVQSESV